MPRVVNATVWCIPIKSSCRLTRRVDTRSYAKLGTSTRLWRLDGCLRYITCRPRLSVLAVVRSPRTGHDTVSSTTAPFPRVFHFTPRAARVIVRQAGIARSWADCSFARWARAIIRRESKGIPLQAELLPPNRRLLSLLPLPILPLFLPLLALLRPFHLSLPCKSFPHLLRDI